MQDIQGGVVITVQLRATVGARVPSHTEVFLDDALTAGTRLTGAMRSHLHDRATSLFRFVASHRDEGSPACIQNRFVQTAFGGGSVWHVLAMLILLRDWRRGHVLNL
jgi:hypothetical protein